MPNIYNILSKHFLKETSPEEESVIEKFKKNNPTEYRLLLELWNKEGVIEVKDFNTEEAWKSVLEKVGIEKKKPIVVVPFYKRYSRVAAIAAVLIIAVVAAYYFVQPSQTMEPIVTKTISGKEAEMIVLSDGSKVWLNDDASLAYSDEFSNNQRLVALTGEAYFEVYKNPAKPFVVKTSNAMVTVLGTSFNIDSDEGKTAVTVNTGKVKVSNKENSDYVVITKGKAADVIGMRVEQHEMNNPNYLAWKTGEFVFNETEISRVLDDLNTYYSKRLSIKNVEQTNCSLTANFKQAKIEDVIEIIELTCDVKVIVEL